MLLMNPEKERKSPRPASSFFLHVDRSHVFCLLLRIEKIGNHVIFFSAPHEWKNCELYDDYKQFSTLWELFFMLRVERSFFSPYAHFFIHEFSDRENVLSLSRKGADNPRRMFRLRPGKTVSLLHSKSILSFATHTSAEAAFPSIEHLQTYSTQYQQNMYTHHKFPQS